MIKAKAGFMQSKLTRRGVMGLTAGAGLAACTSPESISGKNDGVVKAGAFAHGVASGDPFTESVVLWTRLTADLDGDIEVVWDVASDPDFNSIVATGSTSAQASRDYCVKVIAEKLKAGQEYFYRFRAGKAVSQIGRTRTLPKGRTDQLRFAVVSCANWQHGYFNTYDAIAKRAETQPYDALIHLGDYYYEYGALETPRLPDRIHEPAHEIIELNDYRQRHAQYRTDAALQSATAKMPLIAVWDDHETTNDSWTGGAENHQPDQEGDWGERQQAALRAYYEWMPIREPRPGRVRSDIYRNFRFGDLANLTCVETRLTARAEPIIVEAYIDEIASDGGADKFRQDILYAPDREMFGADQQDFIINAMRQSKDDGVVWRLLANQVIMGRLLTPDFTPYIDETALTRIEKDWPGVRDFLTLSKYNMPVYPDSWDGYPVARENFYTALDEAGLNDMLVLTGDAHEFWLNDLTSESGTKFGMEVVTSSVSSQTLTAYLGDATPDHNLLLTQENPDARYYNATRSGFIDLTLTPKAATVRMLNVDTVLSRDYMLSKTAQFTIRKSGDTLKAKSPKGLNMTQRALFHGLG
jgi:phosphodiesterase/alkaline phosphatase D-like protein